MRWSRANNNYANPDEESAAGANRLRRLLNSQDAAEIEPSSKAVLAASRAKWRSHRRLAERVAAEPGLLAEILAGLEAEEPRIKYGCSKVLRLASQKHPAILYPRFDFFAGLLDADNNFLKWDAARIVASLAAVDSEGKLEPLLDRYLRPIRGPVMITAANLIANAATIALARPDWAGRIARAVLKVERAEYQTAECRNVAIGHAIESFDRFFHLLNVKEQKTVVKFVRRQLDNRRNAVRKKAATFIKRHEIKTAKDIAAATQLAGIRPANSRNGEENK